MRASFCAVMALWAAPALAQSVDDPSETTRLGYEIIFNAPGVQRIALDAARGSLFAAVSPLTESSDAVSDIVWWTLGPIRLNGKWSTDTLVSGMAVSVSGLVYAAGQRDGTLRTKGGSAPRSGSVIGVDPKRPASEPFPVLTFDWPEDTSKIDPSVRRLTRFSQVAFDGRGSIYLAAPSQFSVAIFPDGLGLLPAGTIIPQLLLQCGAPGQLSLFDRNEQVAYASSAIDGALLEVGLVEPADATAPDCYRVTNVFEYPPEKPPSTLNSVVHAALVGKQGSVDAVLALEPNTGVLHLLGLDDDLSLSRVYRQEVKAPPSVLTLLSASRDGSIIFVGGQSENQILRFRRDGNSLVQVGTLQTGAGLKQIEISPDGSLAALVLTQPSGLDRIHLIRNPGAMADGGEYLGLTGETLLQVQTRLNELGFPVGVPDGMLGPRTLAAIAQYELSAGSHSESVDNMLTSAIAGVVLTRPSGDR